MISLVSTIFNDRSGLDRFFSSIAQQTRLPDEILIVDAGSSDGSWELLQEESARCDRNWRLCVFQENQCNVARGRNLAIEAATGTVIVSTDIGCNWGARWFEELVRPIVDNQQIDLVIGSWAVNKEELVGPWALVEWALRGDQRLEADADSYSSSRSIAYRKSVWRALGKYPEDLTLAADDAVFHYLVEKAEVCCVGAPLICCWWHRHSDLQGFFKEAFRYGLGDGEAGIRKKDVILIGGRMVMEALGLVLGIVALISGVPGAPWLGFMFLTGAFALIGVRLWIMRSAMGRLRAECVDYALTRLLVLTYGTKWYWLKGYFQGIRRGRVYCLDCRQRLAEMTPALYRQRLAEKINQ